MGPKNKDTKNHRDTVSAVSPVLQHKTFHQHRQSEQLSYHRLPSHSYMFLTYQLYTAGHSLVKKHNTPD